LEEEGKGRRGLQSFWPLQRCTKGRGKNSQFIKRGGGKGRREGEFSF